MELVIIKEDTPEYKFMWEWLGNHPLNKDLELPMDAPNEGEQWQYMGTFKQGDRAVHEFRHRNHPVTNTVQLLTVVANNLTDDQLEDKTT